MLANLRVPGVYVQEIRTLPPSVAAVPTAIPAFIGYTEISTDGFGESLVDRPQRIESQKDYEAIFGYGPRPTITSATLDANNNFITADVNIPFHLYDAIRLFYANGGGECFVCSTGNYAGGIDPADFTGAGRALAQIALVDEPTLLLFPDAAALTAAELAGIQQVALAQCGALQDRFTVCDCVETDTLGTNFRDEIGTNNLKYGAAYTPWLSVRLERGINYGMLRGMALNGPTGPIAGGLTNAGLQNNDANVVNLLARYDLIDDVDSAYRDFRADPAGVGADETALTTAISDLHDATDADADGTPVTVTTPRDAFLAALTAYTGIDDTDPAQAAGIPAASGRLSETHAAYRTALEAAYQPEANLRNLFPAYRAIADGINNLPQATPPSGAVTGIYARTDAQRGVWKAPANESLNGVLAPAVRFTTAQLGNLNIHPAGGKSINAIRSFTGRGTLVYGARTLAGNDSENRYVNVRRLLIFLEESIKKAAEQFVFEPNDANTWIRVRGMIENFLELQWRAGALQGARVRDAYRVAIGLGTTMTADDVTSGRMIIEISLAPVRPAEFIILRFSQQQAQS
ncbi:phage tail sheath C-terminal domain-containing protein [Neolewinella lacunae]|uniref:Phage tail sheath family protein n=1 Tax=Neolewinella lacunae TaxID=1517758 RepID=A0A923PIC9_9BACT|nr:phage tail sheath C-terminal domain-containing protein [Neolewinella lacunae]MBC6993246.1 phage tail sheath family protein [Neolewinella lacunae]MDN3635707.1 phage tail sheath C-terminal domain-containing protein [Neolewinella lacunae]